MDIETGKQTGYSHPHLSNMKYRMTARCIAIAEIIGMVGGFIYICVGGLYIGFTRGISYYAFDNITALFFVIGVLVIIFLGVLPFLSAVALLKSTSSTDNQDISKKRKLARFWHMYTIFLLVLGTIVMIGVGIVFIYHGFGAFAVVLILLRYESMIAVPIVLVYFVKKYIDELEFSIHNNKFAHPVSSLAHSRY